MHNMKCLIAACAMAVVAAQRAPPTAPPPPTAAITVPGQDLAAGYEAEYLPVVQAIVDVIESQEPGFRPLLVRLAWHSCATFNPAALPVGGSTGGCARGAPEADLHDNKGIDKATGPLEAVKSKFPFVSYADLYQLAGNTAMEYMGTPPLYFRPGRTDFANSDMSTQCVNDDMRLPQKNINAEEAPHRETQEYFFAKFAELGFTLDTDSEALYKITALMGGHTFGTMHQEISRQEGNWTLANLEWGNDFYTNLMDGPWFANETREMNDSIDVQYRGGPQPGFVMLPIDFQMRRDDRISAICNEFKVDLPLFEKYFLIAWRQLQENGVVWPTDPPATTAPQGTTDAPATDAPTTEAPATTVPDTDAPAVVAPDTDTPSMQGSGFVASCASNNVNLGNIQMSYVVGQDAGQDQVQFTLTVNSGSSPQFAALGFADDATPDTMNGLNIVACSTSVIPQGFAEVSVSGAPTTQDNTETTPGTSTEAGGSLTCTFQRNIYDVDPVSSTKSLVFGAAFGIAFAMGTGEVGSTWVSHGAEPNRGRQSMTIDKCDTQAAPTTAPATNAPPTVAPSTTAPDTTSPKTDAPATDEPDTVTPTSTPTSAPATDAPPTAAPPTAHPGIDATNAPATGVPDTDAPATNAPATTAPTTDAPATAAPATDAPSTAAPSTTAPKTDAPLTQAPQTGAPATGAPDTTAPLTQAPATDAPATSAPPTAHPGIPATNAPATGVPDTDAPATTAPVTTAPMTDAPATSAPPTAHPGIPATDAPATSVPTSAPSTAAPATDAPLTEAPATDASTTGTPTTTAPRTAYPGIVATDAPMTDAPATDAPATMSPRTAFPGIAATDAPATDAPATDAPTTTAPRTAYPGIPETTSPETETPPVREGGAASSDSDGSDTGAGFPYWALGIAGGVVAMCVAGAAVAHMKMQSGRLHLNEFFDNEMSMNLDDQQQPVEPTSLRV